LRLPGFELLFAPLNGKNALVREGPLENVRILVVRPEQADQVRADVLKGRVGESTVIRVTHPFHLGEQEFARLIEKRGPTLAESIRRCTIRYTVEKGPYQSDLWEALVELSGGVY
jgi:hypothetical protein